MQPSKKISELVKDILPECDNPLVDQEVLIRLVRFWQLHSGIIAGHSTPLLYRSGRLVVHCDSPAWATHARHQAPSLLRQLKEHNFCVDGIEVRVRPRDPGVEPQPYGLRKPAPIPKASAQAMENLAEKLRSKKLSNALGRLARQRKD